MQLVRNEQLKLYVKKSTWVLYGILALIAIAGALIVLFLDDGSLKTYGDDWRQELQAENEQLTEEMENQEFFYPGDLEKNNYHLENDIKPMSYDAWRFVLENAGLASVISLFTIIIAAGIMANEFKWGTIKLLLIRPVSRTKILFSKYISVLLFALTMLLFLFVFSWVLGAILFGVNGMNPSIVLQQASGYAQINVIEEILVQYGLGMVTLIMMATFAFMISTIFRSGGIAIGLAIFLMFAGSTVAGVLSNYNWSKFILFANTDLSQYTAGREPLIEGMTLSFSVTVLAVYFIIFLLASWLVFTRRDVAGQ